MNLSSLLAARTATGKPIRIGLIGAGKFGSMVLAQAKHIPGYQIVGIRSWAPTKPALPSPAPAGRPKITTPAR
jgi:predicted homoserine dehydrogenase-like protein